MLGGGGGGVDDEGGGGVFGIVDGVGQVALASITDPSGHVLVVRGGVNVCVHNGSFGFFVQSTGGGVPVVQLPAAHIKPELFPPDVVVDVLFGGIADDVLLGALNIIDDMLDGFVKFVDVVLVELMGIVAFARLVVLVLGITVNVAELEVDL